MRERVSRRSAATLEKLRSLFVAIPGTGGGFAVLADFAKVLTWGELLHTSYFDVAGASSASAVGPFCAWHIVQSTGSDPLTDEIKPRITETQRDWYGRQQEGSGAGAAGESKFDKWRVCKRVCCVDGRCPGLRSKSLYRTASDLDRTADFTHVAWRRWCGMGSLSPPRDF